MNDRDKVSSVLGEALLEALRLAVRQEIQAAIGQHGNGRCEIPALLSSAQVAKQLSVPESWISERARKGTIPSVRLGHYVRFKPEDVERIIAQNENGKEKGGA